MPTSMPPIPPLEIVRYYDTSLTSTNAKNLLFLGDGFAQNDGDLFDSAVEQITRRIFEGNNPPFSFREIRNKFIVYKAFIPSTTSGISCASSIDNQGRPTESNTGDRLTEKNSALGLQYIGKNSRVITQKTNDELLIPKIIQRLTHPHEKHTNSAVPQCWERPIPSPTMTPYLGKDYGLVVVLINDDLHGGSTLVHPQSTNSTYPYFATAVSLGRKNFFNLVINPSSNLIDHDPASSTRKWWNQTASIVLHELGHSSFSLGDEYEEFSTQSIAASIGIDIANTSNYFSTVQCWRNLVTAEDILDIEHIMVDPAKLDNLKWNKAQLYPGSSKGLISQRVLDYLKGSIPDLPPLPLYIRDITTCMSDKLDSESKFPPETLWTKLSNQQWKNNNRTADLIGLYEGGGGYGCGIYRPAGRCKMRESSLSDSFDFSKRDLRSTDFCFVCMYLIVEQIDPSVLQELDRYYLDPEGR